MFRGSFAQKIDEKGRVSFPARFREVLASTGSDQLCVTNFRSEGQPCLDVYPYSKWLELEERLQKRTDRAPNVIKFFQNFYFPGVQECQIDKQGRILLMPRLRDWAQLEKDVMFAGVGNVLRIFSLGNWDKVFKSGEQNLADAPEVLQELGI